MFKKGDFHVHSKYSDGSLSPEELVILAKSRNVDIFALTDHNSTCGASEAVFYGKKLGVTIIPAVELSTKHNDSRVHILGFFKDDSYNNELLKIALSCVKNHRTNKLKDWFNNFFDDSEINENLSTKGGIKLLKFFGATVVLAHPVLIPFEVFQEILPFGFDGIEAKYYLNSDADTENFLEIAKQNNMIYTAGSDFHKYEKWYRAHGLLGEIYLDGNEIQDFLTIGNLLYHIN